jgi:hypothetical protein
VRLQLGFYSDGIAATVQRGHLRSKTLNGTKFVPFCIHCCTELAPQA